MRDHFVDGVIESMHKHPLIRGDAKFIDPHTLEVEGKKYSAASIIICTGSKPHIPEVFQNYEDDILTTDTLFEQEDLPESMAVIGMGTTGAETAQALARLGTEVFAFEPADTVMGVVDHDIADLAKDLLRQDMRLYVNTNIRQMEPINPHYRLITESKTTEMSGILVCAGREPDLEGLNLEALDIECAEDGLPKFDPETLKIKDHQIYIAGDANNRQAILHEAANEGTIAAQHALNIEIKDRRFPPFTITFTHPSYVSIGKVDPTSENLIVGAASFQNQARARMKGENFGLAKLYADPHKGTLVGAEILAPAGEHLGHFIYLAIERNMKAQELLDIPFYHPTLEEGLRPALKGITEQLS